MSLSKRKRGLLREYVNYTCESCKKHEDKVGELEPHRIRPNDEGGTYEHRNIKMCCKKCHDIFSSAQRMARGIQ
ncbi:MAG: HNH endonuclease [Nanoarchaeota archaeon]|nr:HNH endonuclease [Nanoarchaeota archaeon]